MTSPHGKKMPRKRKKKKLVKCIVDFSLIKKKEIKKK